MFPCCTSPNPTRERADRTDSLTRARCSSLFARMKLHAYTHEGDRFHVVVLSAGVDGCLDDRRMQGTVVFTAACCCSRSFRLRKVLLPTIRGRSFVRSLARERDSDPCPPGPCVSHSFSSVLVCLRRSPQLHTRIRGFRLSVRCPARIARVFVGAL